MKLRQLIERPGQTAAQRAEARRRLADAMGVGLSCIGNRLAKDSEVLQLADGRWIVMTKQTRIFEWEIEDGK